jgi:hypothetical protein
MDSKLILEAARGTLDGSLSLLMLQHIGSDGALIRLNLVQ